MPDIWEVAERCRKKKGSSEDQKLFEKYESLKKSDSTCSTFVYAAHLPPGHHQFLIYCPKTKRLFIKDIFVDLSSPHFFPEYPISVKSKIKPKTSANVWRKWREDSDIDVTLALQEDFTEKSYEPSLFLKNELDREFCNQIIEQWWHKLKIVHIDNLTNCFFTSYPEVDWNQFCRMIDIAQGYNIA